MRRNLGRWARRAVRSLPFKHSRNSGKCQGAGKEFTNVTRGNRMTEQDCIDIGGHCFKSEDIILTTNPPQYPETCIHCGKRRIGTTQDPMSYTDA